MANVYTPPGVSVRELTTPTTSPLLAVPARVSLIGLASGTITKTEVVTMTGTTAQPLTGVPSDAVMTAGTGESDDSIVKIIDAVSPGLAPSGYVLTTDYTFNASNHTITRVNSGAIPAGNTVYVTYTYTPADYFTAIRLFNLGDIEDRFGTAYTSAGTAINSPLSFAASLAFENGAQEVVLKPLHYNNAGVLQQPTPTQAAALATWQDNYLALRDYDDINIVVPVHGQSMTSVDDTRQLQLLQAAQDHVKWMKDNNQYVIVVGGDDSSASSSVGQMTTLRSNAATLAARYGGGLAEQFVYLSPSKYTRQSPAGNGALMTVGGQYMAAAIAGSIAGAPVSATLTRRPVSGFFTVGEVRTRSDKDLDAAAGLLVVEQRGNNIQVRHGITLDTTSTAKREISIVRAKHRVIESVQNTIETQIIGKVIADSDAPLVVRSSIIGVLDGLRAQGDIVGFGDVQARTLSLDPTTIEVRFSYRPAFPVNYVNVVFSLDLTSGAVTLPNTAQATATF